MSEQPSYQVKSHFDKLKISNENVFIRFLARRWWLVLAVVLVVSAFIYFGYNYLDTRSKLAELTSSQNAAQSEAQGLVNDISQHLELPNETPTVASVNDASKLNSQEFFKSAQDGDKVLIFSKSGRALLYRPSTKKIIEYAKVDLSTTQNQ